MNIKKLLSHITRYDKMFERMKVLSEKADTIICQQQELLKAQVFNDTIKECSWVSFKSFSPTGWALNYNALYFIFRVLDQLHPTNILEFGLGQSSKLIYQYTKAFPTVNSITYEHDSEWVSFFNKNLPEDIKPNVILTELFPTTFKEEKTLSYKDNCNELKTQKFDLILVDGPFGSDHYSRSQILNIVPDCLMDSFVIIIDDAQRNGEQETISELLKILDNNHIEYHSELVTTNRSFFTVYSNNIKFITTI